MEQSQLMKKYILRSLTFANVFENSIAVVRSRETINKPFVIISALSFGSTFKNIDASKFDFAKMGFTDEYAFLKKMSLLPFVGNASDTSVSQLWLHTDLTDFEMTLANVYLDVLVFNPDVDFPIVHILESQA
jgi:hypothetical protein